MMSGTVWSLSRASMSQFLFLGDAKYFTHSVVCMANAIWPGNNQKEVWWPLRTLSPERTVYGSLYVSSHRNCLPGSQVLTML